MCHLAWQRPMHGHEDLTPPRAKEPLERLAPPSRSLTLETRREAADDTSVRPDSATTHQGVVLAAFIEISKNPAGFD